MTNNRMTLPPDELASAVARYEKGDDSIGALAKEHGMGYTTMRRILVEDGGAEVRPQGAQPANERVPMRAEDVATAWTLYDGDSDSGQSLEDVAAVFGVSRTTLAREFRRAGHEVRPVGRRQGTESVAFAAKPAPPRPCRNTCGRDATPGEADCWRCRSDPRCECGSRRIPDRSYGGSRQCKRCDRLGVAPWSVGA